MKNFRPLLLLLSLAFCGNLVSQNVEFENLKVINTEELDFSPTPFGNGIMFTSSKSDRFLSCPSYGDKDSYVDLYYAEKNPDGTWKEPVALKGKVNGKYNDGVPAFNPNGEKMIFTRNNLDGRNDQNIIDLKMYTGDFENETWVNTTSPLPFNSDDWSTAHPALSSDGRLLIFSSNRPGSTLNMEGEPSMDLWGSRFENDVWSIPFNLGPSVNTGLNELFPTLDSETGTLFFSSNGHPGEGGLDIFAAALGTGDEWELLGNIGEPFNTSSDDMHFVPLNNATEGYMASDRSHSDAKGRDDIYYWNREPDFQDAVIQVVDKLTGLPLPNSDVSIDPGAFKNESMVKYGPVIERLYGGGGEGELVLEPLKLKTDNEGLVKLRILSPATFAITAAKSEYKPATRNPTDEELTENPVYIIPLEQDKHFAKLIVRVVEDPSGNPIPLANINVINKRTGAIVPLIGDNGGEATTQIDCDDDYEITASKEPYQDNSETLENYEIDCQDGEVIVIVRLKAPVILEPIFFDFDRFYVRNKDAVPTLDSLASIMKHYPSLYIQLEGNTDSRGSHKYNVALSTNRAKSARKYLIKKGIDEGRLSTDWFGEEKLANNCADNIVCPEADHQINRRVDVVPVRHEEAGVKFVTRDLSDMIIESDRK